MTAQSLQKCPVCGSPHSITEATDGFEVTHCNAAGCGFSCLARHWELLRRGLDIGAARHMLTTFAYYVEKKAKGEATPWVLQMLTKEENALVASGWIPL